MQEQNYITAFDIDPLKLPELELSMEQGKTRTAMHSSIYLFLLENTL